MEFVGSRPYVATLRTPSLGQPLAVFGVLGKGRLKSSEKEKRDTEMGHAAQGGSFSAQSAALFPIVDGTTATVSGSTVTQAGDLLLGKHYPRRKRGKFGVPCSSGDQNWLVGSGLRALAMTI